MASSPAVFALRSNIAGRAYRFPPFAPPVPVLFLVRHSQAGQEPLRLPCARKSLLKRRLPGSAFGLFALSAALLAKHSTRNAPQFYPPAFAKFAPHLAWHSLVRDSESSAVALQPAG